VPTDFQFKAPYGEWVTGDGTRYLFNRFYNPILKAAPGHKAEPCETHHWVDDIIKEVWFWKSDCFSPWSRNGKDATINCRKVLKTWPDLDPAVEVFT
jgi:hypothetical protein